MSKTYTIAELEALPDANLCALAAELRGWKLLLVGDMYHWCENDIVRQDWLRWTPATNCNQSRELLEWLTASFAYNSKERGVRIDITFLAAGQPGYVTVQQAVGANMRISGTSARSETIAFCAAMLAQQGRLKQ